MKESTWPGDLRISGGNWTTSGRLQFARVERRLRATRKFVRLVEDTVEREIRDLRAEAEDAMSAAKEEQVDDLQDEFPLLAWATALGFCLSTLETLLAACARDAAEMSRRPAPTRVHNPQVEGWLDALTALGVTVRVPTSTQQDFDSLRNVRNELTHGLQIDEERVGVRLRPHFNNHPEKGLVPTPALVRFAIDTVESYVAAVDRAFVDFGERLQLGTLWRRQIRRGPLPGAD